MYCTGIEELLALKGKFIYSCIIHYNNNNIIIIITIIVSLKFCDFAHLIVNVPFILFFNSL